MPGDHGAENLPGPHWEWQLMCVRLPTLIVQSWFALLPFATLSWGAVVFQGHQSLGWVSEAWTTRLFWPARKAQLPSPGTRSLCGAPLSRKRGQKWNSLKEFHYEEGAAGQPGHA